tara:strand:+ start:73 stop:243 length:171 start_codon:yes stop_codon:yes gene_type:complete
MFDVFSDKIGTIHSGLTLADAEKQAKKAAKVVGPIAIFKTNDPTFTIVKWVFPKKG